MINQSLSNYDNEPNSYQMCIFYKCLGFTLLGHESGWIGMNITETKKTIFSYIDYYGDLIPVLNLGQWFTGMCHFLFFIAAAIIILSPNLRIQRITALFYVPFLSTAFFIQGYKPANHYFVLLVIVYVHLTYWLLSLRKSQKDQSRILVRNDAYHFLQMTLMYVIVLTYLLAGISKLNHGFITLESSSAASFVWKPLSPFNRFAKLLMGENIQKILWLSYSIIGIIVTLVIELIVPLFILYKNTRFFALTSLMAFHLLILAFSALDFSLICMCTYPLIISQNELQSFIEDYTKRPTRLRILAATLFTFYCTFINVHEKTEGLTNSLLNFTQVEVLFRAFVTWGITYLFASATEMAIAMWTTSEDLDR